MASAATATTVVGVEEVAMAAATIIASNTHPQIAKLQAVPPAVQQTTVQPTLSITGPIPMPRTVDTKTTSPTTSTTSKLLPLSNSSRRALLRLPRLAMRRLPSTSGSWISAAPSPGGSAGYGAV